MVLEYRLPDPDVEFGIDLDLEDDCVRDVSTSPSARLRSALDPAGRQDAPWNGAWPSDAGAEAIVRWFIPPPPSALERDS